jgi:hypothetical protein
LQFLRHIERTKVLVHLVDLSDLQGRDPVEDFETVNRELNEFNPPSSQTHAAGRIKLDAMDDVTRLKSSSQWLRTRFGVSFDFRGYRSWHSDLKYRSPACWLPPWMDSAEGVRIAPRLRIEDSD